MERSPAFDDNGVLSLPDGTVLLRHSAERPFLTALRGERHFTVFHGNVKERAGELTAVPLTESETQGDTAAFSGGGLCVRAKITALENGVRLDFSGPEGCAWRFCLPPERDVFGSGERYGGLSLRGGSVPNLVTEHISVSSLMQKALLPRALYREKDNSSIGSYIPMPVYVTADRGLIVFDCAYSGRAEFFDTGCEFTFDELPRSLTVLRCESFPDVSRALAALYPNRQYIPDWCREGMILGVQGGSERVEEIVGRMLSAGAKLSAVWCQDWCGQNLTPMGHQVRWNYSADETLYPDLPGLIARLREKGVRFLAYLNPYLLKDSPQYEECREKGWLITHADGSVYHIRSTTFDAGMLDLTNPAVCNYIKNTLIRRNMLQLGISGWMCDFGEYLPMDCVLHSGDPAALHNLWPVMWARLNREAIDEWGDPDVFFFARSGYPGSAAWVPVFWNGDQHTDFSRDYGLPSVISASLSAGLSGIPLMHSDCGGFFSFLRIRRGSETLIRWMEMNSLSVLMRSHESLRPDKNAQPYDEAVLPHTARLTALHTALAPYLRAVVEEAAQGLPAMRPAFYHSGDTDSPYDPYSYLLGEDLYVCPVLRAGQTTRDVLLPAGRWQRLGSERVYDGGGRYTVSAPLGIPAAFVRVGSRFADIFEKAGEVFSDERNADTI